MPLANLCSFNIIVLYRFSFASASPDNIKQWKFPDGNFLQNLIGHNAIVNCMAVNSDGVLVSGGGYSYVIISENSVYPCEGHNGSIPLFL